MVNSGGIPAVPRKTKLSEFRSEPFQRRLKCSEEIKVSLFYSCLRRSCTCMVYCSLCWIWTCVFYGRLCCPCAMCACLFCCILCSLLDVFVLQQSVLPCMCMLCSSMSWPEYVYSTADCGVPDHAWSTPTCCPSRCLLKSIYLPGSYDIRYLDSMQSLVFSRYWEKIHICMWKISFGMKKFSNYCQKILLWGTERSFC